MSLEERFGTVKPVIAMVHFPGLPGRPRHDRDAGRGRLLDVVGRDLEVLQEAGVDAVLFCNENDRPYQLRAGLESAAAMTRVVTECRPPGVPFGVDFLWDARCALAGAAATGAAFIREVATLTGTHAGPLFEPSIPERPEIPPTGKRFTNTFATYARVVDGKEVEFSLFYDRLEILRQLGTP